MISTAYDKALTSVLCWREARGDGREGMRGVAHVVANRAKVWGKSWAEIVTQNKQFSSMTILGDTQTVLWPIAEDVVNFQALLDLIYSGCDIDNTCGALYYANEIRVTSGWYREHIIEDVAHPITAVIGEQTFRK